MTNPPRPGYWLANDGKWYPPELHPDRIRERLAAEREERDEVIPRPTAEAQTSTPENPAVATPPVDKPPDNTVPDNTVPDNTVPDTASLASPMPHPSTPPLEDDLPVAEIDGPTDAELLAIEQLDDGDLPVDTEVRDASGISEPPTEPELPNALPEPDSRWSRSDVLEPADTVPLVPPAVDTPDIAAPDIASPDLASPDLASPDLDTTDIETLAAPSAEMPPAPPVFEPPAAEVTAPPVEPAPAPTQAAATAEAPTRSPIPEPFPEASADDLVEAEPQKSFIRRWWLPLVLVLGALALVNWVIMPYIDTDRTSADDDQLNVFELAAGTCINEAELELQTELKGTVERVPCSSTHTHEIFHTVNHPEGTFDRELIREFATAECVGMFETYTGEFYSRSELKFILLLPNEQAWDKDDRTTICALFGDGPLTESARS